LTSKIKKQPTSKRTPYWLPATGFYVLVFGLAAATFFLVLLIFHDGGNDVEFVGAGLTASAVIIGGVLLREVVLRGAREKHIAKRRLLDRNILSVPTLSGEHSLNKKFTLDQIKTAIDAIRAKSDAAKVFNRIAAGHKEVFELCEEYRRIIAVEIPNTHPDSPRLKAMVRGRRIVAELHELHLLRWAEIETKAAAVKADNADSAAEKAEYENKARNVVSFALRYYPEDQRLLESARYLESGSEEAKGDLDPEFKLT
jgi:hypothetical protein